MKKKFLALILAAAMSCLLLTSCGGGGGSSGTVSGGDQEASNGKVSIRLLGASWEEEYGYVWVYYSAEIKNTNSKTSGGCQLTVTSRDADNKILDVSSIDYTGSIAARDTVRFSGKVFYSGDAPETVELSIGSPMGGYGDFEKVAKSSEFEITNQNLIKDSKITGEVINHSDVTPTNVRVSVLFKKNGKYIGGDYTYVNDVQANGGKAAFEVYIPDCCEGFESYEVVAAEW